MSRIVELLEQFNLEELFTESRLKGVRFFKSLCNISRTPMIYDPGICIVTQGHKVGYLGDMVFQWDANNYLVTSVSMPFECETFASADAPLLGLYIDVDMPLLHELVGELGKSNGLEQVSMSDIPKGIGPAKLDNEMYDAVVRLLKCLHSKTEAGILGPGLVKEILYRVLCGTQAPALYALAAHNSSFSRIARALKSIHSDYAEKLDVEQLSRLANMSVSAFHRAFKEVTSESPVQYLKKVRLSRARDFILQEQMKAYIAADKVGYASPSQFSREFKRYFGQSPSEMVKENRFPQTAS